MDELELPPAQAFTWHCHVCPFKETWTTELAAQCAAVWHVYLAHRSVWLQLVGSERPPQDVKPEACGHLIEHYEGSV